MKFFAFVNYFMVICLVIMIAPICASYYYTIPPTPQDYWTDRMIERIHRVYHGDLLDIGCKWGKTTRALLWKVPHGHATGLDADVQMTTHAHKQYAYNLSLSWICSPIDNVVLPKQYDIIFSNGSLQWISNISTALATMYLALKKGGKGYLALAGLNDGPFNKSICIEMKSNLYAQLLKNKAIFSEPFFEYDIRYFEKMLYNAKFEIITCELEKITYTFGSSDAFVNWLKASPIFKNSGEELCSKFVENIISTYKTMIPENADGSIDYIDYFIYAVITK